MRNEIWYKTMSNNTELNQQDIQNPNSSLKPEDLLQRLDDLAEGYGPMHNWRIVENHLDDQVGKTLFEFFRMGGTS